TAADFTFPKLLNEENLPCKLVVFANDVSPDVLKLVTDYSIDGVILQQTPTAEALEALKSIYLGKQFLPEQVRAAMLQLEDSRRLLGDLSERELEVLRLVAEGKSNSQISEELYITVNTVRFHLANVYQKLGVGNRTEAAKYYLRQDLAPNGQTKLL
ncbi:MAG: LuxR C-terminal-related transcriptional regulator, partial [Thermoleophilia bacterium]